MNRKHLLVGAAAFAVAISVSQPALAQETASEDEATTTTTTTAKEDAIVVTGSRIRRDEFSTAEPITVITSEEITQGGFSNTAEALQSGAVTQGSGQINSYFSGFVVDGGTGANTLGLRGLGPARTLILLNGHRLAPAGTRGAVGSTDLNVLPTAMIQQVEILKAGASSIYGSDAIAGVVNLITKKNLDGFYLEAQHAIPEIGAGRQGRYSASVGYNSGRLNLSASLEYFKRNEITLADADFTSCPTNYRRLNGGAPGTADYIDPRTGRAKCFTLENGGVTVNTLGISTRPGTRAPGVPLNISTFNRFRPNSAITTGPMAGYEGVDGGPLGTSVNDNVRDTFDPRSQEEPLINGVTTWTGYLQGTYDSDILGNAEFFGEVLWNQRKSHAKLYRQLTLDYTVDLIIDDDGNLLDYGDPNPLVPANMRDSILLAPTPTTNGKYVGVRAFIGYGNTDSTQQVDFLKIGGGARGDFLLPDWRYELYLSKAWSDGEYTTESFLIDRLAQSTDVVQNSNGTFSCRSSTPGCVAMPALTPAVVGGQLSPEFRDWIVDPVTGKNKYREFTASFIVDGPLFTLPGGKSQIALGGEFRDASINDRPPEDSINGNLFGLTSSLPTVGSDSVWEVFGEVNLPVLADVPGAYRLTFDASARYTHYDSYGGDVTYKVAGEWEPIRGFAFRGSYGTSYRAPALFEQFLGATSGFLAANTDPCSEPGDDVVAANCIAAGLPADFVQRNGVIVLSQGGAGSGLKAETSVNWSVGGVFRPRFGESFGSLSLALDYYDIKIKDGVAQVGGAAVLDRCYGDASNFNINEGFCRLITRDANNAVTVDDDYVNLSTNIVRGWEFNARYSRSLFGNKFTFNGSVNHYTKQASRLFPDDPLDDVNGIIGNPAWTGNLDATYEIGDFQLRYGMEWIDGDKTKTYEYFGLDPATTQYFLEVKDYYIHTISAQYDLKNFTFTAGVRNFTDSKLPRISSGVFNLVGNAPLYSGYDYRGRTFFVSASAKF